GAALQAKEVPQYPKFFLSHRHQYSTQFTRCEDRSGNLENDVERGNNQPARLIGGLFLLVGRGRRRSK
ncbi:hypothetical protein LTR43_012427, partial [Exophiala xenobiotica]